MSFHTRVEMLVTALLEIAQEMDMGENADIQWLKYQGDLVRQAAEILHNNYSEKPFEGVVSNDGTR